MYIVGLYPSRGKMFVIPNESSPSAQALWDIMRHRLMQKGYAQTPNSWLVCVCLRRLSMFPLCLIHSFDFSAAYCRSMVCLLKGYWTLR